RVAAPVALQGDGRCAPEALEGLATAGRRRRTVAAAGGGGDRDGGQHGEGPDPPVGRSGAHGHPTSGPRVWFPAPAQPSRRRTRTVVILWPTTSSTTSSCPCTSTVVPTAGTVPCAASTRPARVATSSWVN